MQSEEQAQTQTSAGAILRQAREAARMQLPTMAAMLKVPQHKLEALEADQYEAFPDHVFMRALAMGMCRNLHIDAEPVLALLPRTALKSLGSAGGGINETVRSAAISSLRALRLTPVTAARARSLRVCCCCWLPPQRSTLCPSIRPRTARRMTRRK